MATVVHSLCWETGAGRRSGLRGAIAGYRWSCDDAFGYISDSTTNRVIFTAYPSSKRFGLPRNLRVRVVDAYGVWSSTRSLNIDNYLVNSWAERLGCFRCGDANYDGSVDVSDAVYLIQYIFAGGLAPNGCRSQYGLGDANGDDAVDISDAVFLTNYIFAGGPCPHCLAKPCWAK